MIYTLEYKDYHVLTQLDKQQNYILIKFPSSFIGMIFLYESLIIFCFSSFRNRGV